jgi:hypothetical protein
VHDCSMRSFELLWYPVVLETPHLCLSAVVNFRIVLCCVRVCNQWQSGCCMRVCLYLSHILSPGVRVAIMEGGAGTKGDRQDQSQAHWPGARGQSFALPLGASPALCCDPQRGIGALYCGISCAQASVRTRPRCGQEQRVRAVPQCLRGGAGGPFQRKSWALHDCMPNKWGTKDTTTSCRSPAAEGHAAALPGTPDILRCSRGHCRTIVYMNTTMSWGSPAVTGLRVMHPDIRRPGH